MRADLQIAGVRGRLMVGVNDYPDGRPGAKFWELHTDNSNIGGSWVWRYRQDMGGQRYILDLEENGRTSFILTSARFGPGMPRLGAEPPRPWFAMPDQGNGRPVDRNAGSGPERLMSGFSWSVQAIE